jgi:hypothetical protein
VNFLLIVLIVAAFFGVVVVAMAIGVILRGKCLRGSCGGEAVIGPNGELLNCDTCPVRKDKDALARATSQGTRVPASKSGSA